MENPAKEAIRTNNFRDQVSIGKSKLCNLAKLWEVRTLWLLWMPIGSLQSNLLLFDISVTYLAGEKSMGRNYKFRVEQIVIYKIKISVKILCQKIYQP